MVDGASSGCGSINDECRRMAKVFERYSCGSCSQDEFKLIFHDHRLGLYKMNVLGSTAGRDGPGGKGATKSDAILEHAAGNTSAAHFTWASCELVVEHTESPDEKVAFTQAHAKQSKCMQFMRAAQQVFQAQPCRSHVFGLLLCKAEARLCYADHGCIAFSVKIPIQRRALVLGRFLTIITASQAKLGHGSEFDIEGNTVVC